MARDYFPLFDEDSDFDIMKRIIDSMPDPKLESKIDYDLAVTGYNANRSILDPLEPSISDLLSYMPKSASAGEFFDLEMFLKRKNRF